MCPIVSVAFLQPACRARLSSQSLHSRSVRDLVMSSILQSTLHFFTGWRSLLTPSGGGVLSPTAIGLLGATGLYGGQQPKNDTAASDVSILNTALGGEFGAVVAYQLGADSGLLQRL